MANFSEYKHLHSFRTRRYLQQSKRRPWLLNVPLHRYPQGTMQWGGYKEKVMDCCCRPHHKVFWITIPIHEPLFLSFGHINPLPRLDGNELEETFPGNFAKTSLAWLWRAGMENKEEPCFCVERTRPFDVCRPHRQRLNPWSRRKKTKKLFFKKTNYLTSWTLASFGLTDWPVSSGTRETFWSLAAGLANVGLPMAAGGYLLIVLGFSTGKAPLSLADTQRGKYNIEAEFTVDMLV